MNHKVQLALAFSMLLRAGVTAQNHTVAVAENLAFDNINYSEPLSKADFETAMATYDIIIANFYVPWCPICQKMEPTWEAVREEVNANHPDTDGRIHLAKIDCTADVYLCRDHHITAFPSLRVFRKGQDEVMNDGVQVHESYTGDRTKEALMSFVEMLVLSAGRPHYYDSDTSSPNTADLLDFVTLEVMADSSSQPAPVDELDALAKNYIGSASDAASSEADETSASALQLAGEAKSRGEGYINMAKKAAAKGLDYINRKKNEFLISAIEKDPPRVYVDIITDQDLE